MYHILKWKTNISQCTLLYRCLKKGWITDTFWDFVGDAFWQGVFLPKDYKGSWKKGLFYTFYTGKCDTILHTGLTSPPSPSLHSVNFSWAIVVVVFSYVRITNFYYFCKFSLMSQNKISIISVIFHFLCHFSFVQYQNWKDFYDFCYFSYVGIVRIEDFWFHPLPSLSHSPDWGVLPWTGHNFNPEAAILLTCPSHSLSLRYFV